MGIFISVPVRYVVIHERNGKLFAVFRTMDGGFEVPVTEESKEP